MNAYNSFHKPGALRTAGADIANPDADIRIGLIVAGLFFVLFLGWAMFARLDAAAYANGSLSPAGQRQSVQHKEGGVVGEILVQEGQRVQRGQLLINLAAADVRAQEHALASQAIRLLAQRARLRAEQSGAPLVAEPVEYRQLPPEDSEEARAVLILQQQELSARRATLAAQRGIAGTRAAQSIQQARGYRDQVTSADTQLQLLEQELAALKPVAEKGFVSQTRLRQLERTRAELIGQRGQYSASVAQSGEAAREGQLAELEADRTFRERTASDLQSVENQLSEALPKLSVARDQLARTQIRAPATGTIVGLSVFTPGGVIAPGQKLMDIVPERKELVVRARIAPDDADDLALGQTALVRFSSLHERALPNIEGRLTQLSSDNFVDDKTGQSFYTAEVQIAPTELRKILDVRGPGFALRAGMPVEVLIPLKKRTALDYALEPLRGAFWSSFREH